MLIFDCDGVLIDSERIAVSVQAALGAALGWPLTSEEVIARFIGRSHADNRAQVAAQLGAETAAVWSEQFEELRRAAADSELVPVEGISEVLSSITLPTLTPAEQLEGLDTIVFHDMRRLPTLLREQ
ncbi:HAD hydrolase-like protein [Streptomyces sp. NPDC054813]